MERELKKRRDWIQNFRRDFPGKFPDDVSKYYEKDNVKEDKKEGEEEDDDKPAKGKKKKGEKKKGKKGKKGKGDDDEKEKLIKIGPSEIIQKFDEFYGEYNNEWARRDENDNKEQGFDRVMARQEVMPLVEKELQ